MSVFNSGQYEILVFFSAISDIFLYSDWNNPAKNNTIRQNLKIYKLFPKQILFKYGMSLQHFVALSYLIRMSKRPLIVVKLEYMNKK